MHVHFGIQCSGNAVVGTERTSGCRTTEATSIPTDGKVRRPTPPPVSAGSTSRQSGTGLRGVSTRPMPGSPGTPSHNRSSRGMTPQIARWSPFGGKSTGYPRLATHRAQVLSRGQFSERGSGRGEIQVPSATLRAISSNLAAHCSWRTAAATTTSRHGETAGSDPLDSGLGERPWGWFGRRGARACRRSGTPPRHGADRRGRRPLPSLLDQGTASFSATVMRPRRALLFTMTALVGACLSARFVVRRGGWDGPNTNRRRRVPRCWFPPSLESYEPCNAKRGLPPKADIVQPPAGQPLNRRCRLSAEPAACLIVVELG